MAFLGTLDYSPAACGNIASGRAELLQVRSCSLFNVQARDGYHGRSNSAYLTLPGVMAPAGLPCGDKLYFVLCNGALEHTRASHPFEDLSQVVPSRISTINRAHGVNLGGIPQAHLPRSQAYYPRQCCCCALIASASYRARGSKWPDSQPRGDRGPTR